MGQCSETNIPPCHNIRSAFGAGSLFEIHDSLKKTVQVIVCRIIERLEGIKPIGKIRSKAWRIIISKRPLIQMEDVVVIVRKAGNFLGSRKPNI